MGNIFENNRKTVEILQDLTIGKRRKVPDGFWKIKENRIIAVQMYVNGIPKKSLDDTLLGLRNYQLLASNISHLFNGFYSRSIRNMIAEVYPEKLELLDSNSIARGKDFRNIDHCVRAMKEISAKSGKPISRISTSDVYACRCTYMLTYHGLKELKGYYKESQTIDKVSGL